MRVRIFVLGVALAAVAVFLAACGSSNKTLQDGKKLANETPSAAAGTPGVSPTSGFTSKSPTAAVSKSQVDKFGPPPVLGSNITAVFPKWAQSVKQSTTKIPKNSAVISGVCVNISYVPPATSLLWFRMAVDGQEVTQKLTAFQHVQGTATTASTGTLCYQPVDGLSVGIHNAAISVQDPSGSSAAPIQTVGWKFEVVAG